MTSCNLYLLNSPPKTPAYNKHWIDLDEFEKDAARRLGWDQHSWDSQQVIPVMNQNWQQLSLDQRHNAEILGFTEKTWHSKVGHMGTTVPMRGFGQSYGQGDIEARFQAAQEE